MNLAIKLSLTCGTILLGLNPLNAQVFPPAVEVSLPQFINVDTSDPTEITDDDLISLAPAPAADLFIYSVASGEWSNPSTWNCECVPSGAVDVEIIAEHEVTLDMDVAVNSLAIQETALLAFEDNSDFEMKVSGDWFNQGNFSAAQGTVTFESISEQSVFGDNDFHHLNCFGGNQVAIQEAISVEGILDIQGKTLITNGLLTLKSSLSEKAQLAPLFSGSIVGELTYLNVIYTPNAGWLNIGAPMVNATIAQWNDDFVTTGFAGSDYPTYSFVNIQRYDESSATANGSFSPVTSVDDLLIPGEGYYVYVNPGTYTIDVTGEPIIGDFSLPVSYTDYDTPASDGLRLMSNPYPSKVNWDKEEGWEKVNLYSAIYSWDVSTSQFRTYLNGYSVNGGSPVINPCQTFWIQANDNDPELHINENAKEITTIPAINQTMNFVSMRMTNGGSVDEMMVIFSEEGTPAFDLGLDALKLNSPSANINVGTRGEDGTLLAINTTDLDSGNFFIPIAMDILNAGTYSLLVDEMPISSVITACMVIEDTETGLTYPLEEGLEITFETPSVIGQERFIIRVGAALVVESENISCFASADGVATIQGTGFGPWDYELTDTQNNLLASLSEVDGLGVFEGLEEGVYRLHAINNDYCSTLSRIVSIVEPRELEISASGNHLSCGQEGQGVVEILADGGSSPYSYTLDGAPVASSIFGLDAGNYTLSVIDAFGCSQSTSAEITGDLSVEADFETQSGIVYLEDGAVTVNFENTSLNADNYVWEFGMGGETATTENGEFTFTEPGFYLITLYASNENCDDSSQLMLTVENSNGVNDTADIQQINARLSNGMLEIKLDTEVQGSNFELRNIAGQLILNDNMEAAVYSEAVAISSGIYLLRVNLGDQWFVQRLFAE